MAQGRPTKMISTIKWTRTSRLSITLSLSLWPDVDLLRTGGLHLEPTAFLRTLLNVFINHFLKLKSPTQSSTYCLVSPIEILSWHFCRGVDFLKPINESFLWAGGLHLEPTVFPRTLRDASGAPLHIFIHIHLMFRICIYTRCFFGVGRLRLVPTVAWTLNLEPWTLNPKPSTLNPKSQTLNPKP